MCPGCRGRSCLEEQVESQASAHRFDAAGVVSAQLQGALVSAEQQKTAVVQTASFELQAMSAEFAAMQSEMRSQYLATQQECSRLMQEQRAAQEQSYLVQQRFGVFQAEAIAERARWHAEVHSGRAMLEETRVSAGRAAGDTGKQIEALREQYSRAAKESADA